MANMGTNLKLGVTKKYVLMLSMHAKFLAQQAQLECLKARGAEHWHFDECRMRLENIAMDLIKLADADDDGNSLRATCPKCGHRLYQNKDVYGKAAMVFHCFCGTEYKIEKLPGGEDLSPELEAMLKAKAEGGGNGEGQPEDQTPGGAVRKDP